MRVHDLPPVPIEYFLRPLPKPAENESERLKDAEKLAAQQRVDDQEDGRRGSPRQRERQKPHPAGMPGPDSQSEGDTGRALSGSEHIDLVV
jgi:hypothetical protein